MGGWIDSSDDLKRLVVNHFKDLYCEVPPDSAPLNTHSNFPQMDYQSLSRLSLTPNDEEIKDAMFSMGSFKAPGIDGFSPIFYKSNWNTVGPAVCRFVYQAFEGQISLDESNKTLITLIPKRENTELVSYFRPISLCQVHYKCLTKLISLRLKGVMNDIISPYQVSFIKGRHIQDNILIGQELLHIMSKNRSKRGLMSMKIDLEKAFDRISWTFLKQVLLDAGFDLKFVNLIINCVSSVSFNVLWNGEQT